MRKEPLKSCLVECLLVANLLVVFQTSWVCKMKSRTSQILLRTPSSCDQGTIELMSHANVSSSVNLTDANGLRTSVS